MKEKQLLALGFKDTSSPDGSIFNDYTYSAEEFTINVYGDNIVEIKIGLQWSEVPNCKTIADIKHLIRLFSCNP